MKRSHATLWPVGFLFVVALLFCGRAVFTGRVLMPLDMLLLMSPWKAHVAEVAPDFTRPQNPMLDPVQQYYPWRLFAVESVKSGTIPLWTPYSYCGQPFVANLQSAIFYPPNLIFLIMPVGAAFTWSALLHLFLAGLFTFAFLRRWQVHPIAALIGAVAFMLNGFTIGWLEYPAFGLWVIIWLPAVLWAYEKALQHDRWPWALMTGLVLGVQFLGGQLQLSGYLVIAFLLYAAFRAFSTRDRSVIIRRIGFAAVALLLGIALASVQLLPTMELAPLSARAPKTLEQARQTALPATHLIQYLMPYFFGNPTTTGYWGDKVGTPQINFFETGCYVGIGTLLLAWLSLRLWRRPVVGFALALAAISVLLALGSPLFAILFYVGPGMKQLGGLARVLSLAAFGFACLAAFGVDRFLTIGQSGVGRSLPTPPKGQTAESGDSALHTLSRWELPSFIAGVLIAVTLAWTTFSGVLNQNPPLHENALSQLLRFILFLLLVLGAVWLLARSRTHDNQSWAKPGVLAGIILVAVVCDLFSFGMNFNPATDPKLAFFPTRTTDFLRAHIGHSRIVSYKPADAELSRNFAWMLPNTPLAYNLRDTHGYDSLVPGRYTKLIGTTDWSPQGAWPAPGSPLADALAVKYAVTTDELNIPGWKLVAREEANVYENTNVLPRAFAVYEFMPMEDATFLGMMRGDSTSLGDIVYFPVYHPGEENMDATRYLPPPPRDSVRFIRDGLDVVELRVNLPQSSAEAHVVLMDAAYPGWRVSVDGKPSSWRVANYDFRTVVVPSGRHTITWRYEPATFRVGLYVSLAALALLFSALGYCAVGRGTQA